MKVLLVHEYYRSGSPSGEDLVFEREKRLLEENGQTVKTLVFKNDWIGTKDGPSVLKTAFFTAWSPIGKRLTKRAVLEFRPDVAHFHNTFPVLSQSAIGHAKTMGIATVQTLHNFRTICAQAMLIRNNGICEKCVDRNPWPALVHRCYRDSLLATIPLATNIALNRLKRTWQNLIDRIIVLSEFNRNVFIKARFPAEKIKVKPNFFEDCQSIHKSESKKENMWLFVGRIKEEKGVQFLPEVWKKLGDKAPLLKIVGDGPYLENLRSEIISLGLEKKIILLGRRPPEEVQELLRESSLLLFPSIWYEGFPLVIGEAFAAGVPVAVSSLGTPGALVRDKATGIHFRPGDIDNMVEKLSLLIQAPKVLREMGARARKEFEKEYTAQRNFELMMNIYGEAIQENLMRQSKTR